jgi:hypothetical protein
MLLPIIPIYRKRRGRSRPPEVTPTPPPPVALTLVAATFALTPAPPKVTLTFDRPIDVAGFQANQVTVRVSATESLYQGSGAATLVGPAVARVNLAVAGFSGTGGVKLTASGTTGIVAVNDGGTWAGVSNLALPFG